MKKHEEIAHALLPLLGGAGNISGVENCITRMRVQTVDASLMEAAIKKAPGVMGVVNDVTYQIVLGPGRVTRVTDTFRSRVAAQKASGAAAPVGGSGTSDAAELAAKGASMKAAQKSKNDTPMKNLLRKIANIFVPLIPALIACGLVASIKGVLVNMNIDSPENWMNVTFIPILNVIGGAFFAYLAIFAGINAAKEFGCTPALGGAVAAIIVYPSVSDISFNMPFVGEVQLTAGMGGVLGGLFLPLVMLGLHQALVPIHTTLIEQDGFTSLLPLLAMAGAGQVGCAVAVYVKLKRNTGMRNTVKGATPAGILGVGEPLIYGVSLPLGRPFITACLGGAVGGAVVGFFDQFVAIIGATAIGPSGWALIPLVTSPDGQGYAVMVYMLGLFSAHIAGFFLTLAFGFNDELMEEHNRDYDEEFDGLGQYVHHNKQAEVGS